tara:strand:+ start:994 stop:2217 length:1224 start_codon:yes stop_codon:yes gene_type:complete
MATKYDIDSNKRYAPTGYEGDSNTDYVIPSCGVEDLDFAVFNLFDKQIPIYYDLHGEVKKVPIIFATGERFALLRRKRPIVDRNGALILPLISITRSSIENVPSKGIANNQMFPHVVTKRISEKDLAHRQNKNYEQLKNVNGEDLALEPDLSLKPRLDRNIIETIEIPPVKYFGAVYEVSVWSSFTQQMNNILEVILNSYTLNPGQQFQLESDKGYKFSGFLDGNISQDTNYAEFTDAERYIKYNFSLNATGYIIAPNILGGKTALRSFVSAPEVIFEVAQDYKDTSPSFAGVADSNPDAHIFDDLATEDSYEAAQGVGIDSENNRDKLLEIDASKGLAVGVDIEKHKSTDLIAERGSDYSKERKTWVRNAEGQLVPVMAKSGDGKGETLYDASFAEVLFNVSTSKE